MLDPKFIIRLEIATFQVSCGMFSRIFSETFSLTVVFQLGTLGAGNHYAEIQVVDEIYDEYAAKKMGIVDKGQVCVMIHSGSRGFGHQVATGKTEEIACPNY